MALNTDLGNLILNLNPYTNRDVPFSDPPRKVGEMDIYCEAPVPGKTPPDISQVQVEADGPYRQEWTFKGEPQRIGMAYRIKYRFAIYPNPPPTTPPSPPPAPLYWVEDYLLIGFEGAMGG